MKRKLLRSARKNIIFYAELTKHSYWLNEIRLGFDGRPHSKEEFAAFSSQDVLKFYMGNL